MVYVNSLRIIVSNANTVSLSGCIQSWKPWKSHGIPFFISCPGKVMEIDSRFWKIYKKSWKLKESSRNGAGPFFHQAFQCIYIIRSNFGVVHILLYCVSGTLRDSQRQNWHELVALVHISFMPRTM